jgi:hypothetical protein
MPGHVGNHVYFDKVEYHNVLPFLNATLNTSQLFFIWFEIYATEKLERHQVSLTQLDSLELETECLKSMLQKEL